MVEDFREQVKKGFSACKSDIDFLKSENYYFKAKLEEVSDENNTLKNSLEEQNKEIISLKSELKGIQIALDYIKEFTVNSKQVSYPKSSLQENISNSNLEKQISISSQEEYPPSSENFYEEEKPKMHNISAPLKKPRIEKAKDPYEALLEFKAKVNKKEILKQKMCSMISDNGINLSELKFMFVDHFKYSSKATFYNYLKELELEKTIKIERENSKNFVYPNHISKEV